MAYHQNPILHALQGIADGESMDALLALRARSLPTAQSWLDRGWEALGSLDKHSAEAALLVDLMTHAWRARELDRQARRAWSCAAPVQGQVLWQRAWARLAGER